MTNAEAIDSIRDASTGRVGPSTSAQTVEGFKVITTQPSWLASEAGVSVDVYSLARMVASEDYSATPETHLCLAETAYNKAKLRGQSVTRLLTYSSKSAHNTLYGEQAAGRWASTRVDPNGKHIAAAEAALSGTSLANGATDFFDPATQDGGIQGDHMLRMNSEDYIRGRDGEGLHWVGPIAGVDPTRQMFFSRNSPYSLDDGLAAARGESGGGSHGEESGEEGGIAGPLVAGVVLVLIVLGGFL